ncbi:hypothetical protein BaRGS_00015744 [Batillaria attramentaria]|uniref:Uncharacterized protein n=1 Tax=Batillaria attramentaria TaxID=370345 RepID=A0ABD0L1P5_9CAEN
MRSAFNVRLTHLTGTPNVPCTKRQSQKTKPGADCCERKVGGEARTDPISPDNVFCLPGSGTALSGLRKQVITHYLARMTRTGGGK